MLKSRCRLIKHFICINISEGRLIILFSFKYKVSREFNPINAFGSMVSMRFFEMFKLLRENRYLKMADGRLLNDFLFTEIKKS